MKVLLFCAKLCGALGYDALVPLDFYPHKCACVDFVDSRDSITPFNLQWAYKLKEEEDGL